MDPSYLTPAEIEFFAEDTMVEISTTRLINGLVCLRETYGPYRAHIPAEAPLWLALALKRRNYCNIRLPSWLEPQGLLLLKHASDDIENANEIRVLLEDISEVRKAKIKKQLHALQDPLTVGLTNLTMMEINTFRSFLEQTMGHFYEMHTVENAIASYVDDA